MKFFQQPPRSARAQIAGTAILLVIGGALALATESWRAGTLFALGGMLGALLFRTGFAFLAGWREAIVRREMSGVEAQIVLVGASVILFAAALGRGEAFGAPLTGASAPLGLAVAIGGALFGLGLAFVEGGWCLIAAVAAAVAGAWLAGVGAAFWAGLPGLDPVVLPALVRWKGAAPIQIGVLILLWTFARVRAGTTAQRPVRPLIAPAVALAVLGWLVLLVAGQPWHLLPLPAAWRMDVAVALGAVAAAALAQRGAVRAPNGAALAAALAGGLMMGFGAGIAGSNIEGLIAAVASGGLHGWLWLVVAFGGTIVGLRLRRALDQSIVLGR
jgi:uncharacterized protein